MLSVVISVCSSVQIGCLVASSVQLPAKALNPKSRWLLKPKRGKGLQLFKKPCCKVNPLLLVQKSLLPVCLLNVDLMYQFKSQCQLKLNWKMWHKVIFFEK